MTETASSTALDAALDADLVRALPAPALPVDFRERLRAAIARPSDTEGLDVQKIRTATLLATDRVHVLRQAIMELRMGSTVSVPGGPSAWVIRFRSAR